MKFEKVIGYHNFWFFIEKLVPELDINTSLVMPKHNFCINGKSLYTNSYYETLQYFNDNCGTNFIVDLCSVAGNTHFSLAMADTEGEIGIKRNQNIDVPVVESVTDTPAIIEDAIVTEDVVDSKETEEILEGTTPTVDWDWVATLDNTKEGKLALDEYAASKFNIHLSRTMKLENMIKDFREKLGA